MSSAMDLTKVLSDAPRDCWLALNGDQSTIVGRGNTIKEAVEEAIKNGVQEPVIIWAPKTWTVSVYY